MKLQQQALTLGQCLRCHTSKHPPTDQAAKLKKKARGWQALFHSTKKKYICSYSNNYSAGNYFKGEDLSSHVVCK